MKKNTSKKIITINGTTSIEVPEQQLTINQRMDILLAEINRQALISRKIAEAHLQTAINMGKLIDMWQMQIEEQYPQLKMQRMIASQAQNKNLN